jgi:16S rRNA processing protein RimM
VTDETDFVAIGRVRSAHGIVGEVSVEPLTDMPERFSGLARVLLMHGGRMEEVGVVSARRKGSAVLLKLEGTDDRTAAAALVGAELGVRRCDVWPLPEGDHYVFDVVGSSVIGKGGRQVGIVEDVLRMPANDVLVLKTDKGEALVPATKNVVKQIDVKNKVVVIEELEGLLG